MNFSVVEADEATFDGVQPGGEMLKGERTGIDEKGAAELAAEKRSGGMGVRSNDEGSDEELHERFSGARPS